MPEKLKMDFLENTGMSLCTIHNILTPLVAKDIILSDPFKSPGGMNNENNEISFI